MAGAAESAGIADGAARLPTGPLRPILFSRRPVPRQDTARATTAGPGDCTTVLFSNTSSDGGNPASGMEGSARDGAVILGVREAADASG